MGRKYIVHPETGEEIEYSEISSKITTYGGEKGTFWDPENEEFTKKEWHYDFKRWVFDGWEDDDNASFNVDPTFTLDSYKWADIVIPAPAPGNVDHENGNVPSITTYDDDFAVGNFENPPYFFEFYVDKDNPDNTSTSTTKVVYNHKEKRAIVPPEGILSNQEVRTSEMSNSEVIASGMRPPGIMKKMVRGDSHTGYEFEDVTDVFSEVQKIVEQLVTNENSEFYGYDKDILAVVNDPNNQEKTFIISNIWIEDSYHISDSNGNIDTITLEDYSQGLTSWGKKMGRNFINTAEGHTFEKGYGGSVQVYMPIKKLNINTFGDDVYKLSTGERTPLKICGYTDAIIFENTVFTTNYLFNMPGWDGRNQFKYLDRTYNYYKKYNGQINSNLSCRRSRNLFYHDLNDVKEDPSIGFDEINHVFTLIEKDEDISIVNKDGNENTNFINIGDWHLYSARVDDDLIAVMTDDKYYRSPILRYRFNIEDPESNTQLLELLPGVNPKSRYPFFTRLHVYYARNIYVPNWIRNANESSYFSPDHIHKIRSFGENNLEITTASPVFADTIRNPVDSDSPEDIVRSFHEKGPDRDECMFVDESISFYAGKMTKEVDYYDELPKTVDYFYGQVNGRYQRNTINGKKSLRVNTPKFNIPSTVDLSTIKIYISMKEYQPSDAIVQYAWDNPFYDAQSATYTGDITEEQLKEIEKSRYINSITQKNGDYVTFNSDSITLKDVQYSDVLSRINLDELELTSQGNAEHIFTITKPITARDNYHSYTINITTDNSDVMAMNYPSEVVFNNNKAEVAVTFKGVINATTKWSPRIHNGYYYINDQEYHAYSEFNVEADFEDYEDVAYKRIPGSVTIDVLMRHLAKPEVTYRILKETRSELLQDEDNFIWIDKKDEDDEYGLTLKPVIDGKYYKQYTQAEWISPVIQFPEKLSSPSPIKLGTNSTDRNLFPTLYVRSYDLENGEWSEWNIWQNNSVPSSVPLSAAYQVKAVMKATVVENNKELDEYCSCYLDWKDEMDGDASYNVITINDHISTTYNNSEGEFVSNIIDCGISSHIILNINSSLNGNSPCRLYIRTAENENDLKIENILWQETDESVTNYGRYYRYKIVIPDGEICYWLHKHIVTIQTDAYLPKITSLEMRGTRQFEDVVDSIENIESFTVIGNGKRQTVFPSIYNLIAADIHEKGFKDDEIEEVRVYSNNSNMQVIIPQSVNTQYPSVRNLDTPLVVIPDKIIDTNVVYTPFIYAKQNPVSGFDEIIIKGTPQQFCPITVENIDGHPLKRLYNVDPSNMLYAETHYLLKRTDTISPDIDKKDICYDLHYIKLHHNDFDEYTLKIFNNGELVDTDNYHIVNNLIIWDELPSYGDIISVQYNVCDSFYAKVIYENQNDPLNQNTTTITIYTEYESETERHKQEHWELLDENDPMSLRNKLMRYKVFFETDTVNNKFTANRLSLNPIYRTDYKGFIYLTDAHTEPYSINIYCNPKHIKYGGYDKIDVNVEVLDIDGNPCIETEVYIDCLYGIIIFDDNNYTPRTDINGVIHFMYHSAMSAITDTITAKVLTKKLNAETAVYEDTEISSSVEIENI